MCVFVYNFKCFFFHFSWTHTNYKFYEWSRDTRRMMGEDGNAVKVAASTIATKKIGNTFELNVFLSLCVALWKVSVLCAVCVSPVSISCIQILYWIVLCCVVLFLCRSPARHINVGFRCFCHILCKTNAAGYQLELWWRQWTAVTMMWMMKGGTERDILCLYS